MLTFHIYPGRIKLFRDPAILVCLGISLCALIVQGILLALRLHPTADPVPLHYNIYFGIDLIGAWWHIFLFPGIGLLILLLNSTLLFLVTLDKMQTILLMASAALTNVLLTVSLILLLTYVLVSGV
ncbi:MAG: hypothetical protein WC289_05195 [Patescibacteria group bacterium]|jgi:hypothetical protein